MWTPGPLSPVARRPSKGFVCFVSALLAAGSQELLTCRPWPVPPSRASWRQLPAAPCEAVAQWQAWGRGTALRPMDPGPLSRLLLGGSPWLGPLRPHPGNSRPGQPRRPPPGLCPLSPGCKPDVYPQSSWLICGDLRQVGGLPRDNVLPRTHPMGPCNSIPPPPHCAAVSRVACCRPEPAARMCRSHWWGQNGPFLALPAIPLFLGRGGGLFCQRTPSTLKQLLEVNIWGILDLRSGQRGSPRPPKVADMHLPSSRPASKRSCFLAMGEAGSPSWDWNAGGDCGRVWGGHSQRGRHHRGGSCWSCLSF